MGEQGAQETDFPDTPDGWVRRWQMELHQSVPDLLELRSRGRDVLLEQRSDARVGKGLALIGLLRSRRSCGVPRL